MERYLDTTTGFTQEDFPPDGRGDQSNQRVTFFDSAEPYPGRFLLHYAPGWDSNTKTTPVLLAHYVKPPYVPEHADVLVESMLTTRTGDDHYPGTSVPVGVWPGVAPGDRGAC